MKNLKGQFLVASPHLADRNFYRSVILMVQHDKDGAIGLILNRPTNSDIESVWKLVADTPCEIHAPIYLGGPVPGPMLVVHPYMDLSEGVVMPGLYLATSKELLGRIIRRPDGQFRIFTGYAGWGAGQLEEEMQVGGWLTMSASVEHVFHDSDNLWELVTAQINRQILGPALGQRPLPEDPSVN